ncbi:MAG: hypothetical protein OEM04_04265 [Flavobacteriaceae bacterium]|nr:hypothetical protein [Flavobacteriaceae bacterium]
MEIIKEALAYTNKKLSLKSRDDKIRASQKLKDLILRLNEVYKSNKDPKIMDIMKRLTLIKRKVEVRLYAKLIV